MKILTYSNLYPNDVNPSHGIFIERRLLELRKAAGIEAAVVAPVPWFPSKSEMFGGYEDFAKVAESDRRHGISILHPRYPVIPKVGMRIAPYLMTRAVVRPLREFVDQNGPFSLLDAHYFYPDGVAAARIADELKLPYVITARGSDINLIAQYKAPAKAMLRAAEGAKAVIAVSDALASAMADLGMDPGRIYTIRNGVDLDFFSPGEKQDARKTLGSGGPVFLSAGALKEAKGHDIAIHFVSKLVGSHLVVIGHGPDRHRLTVMADELGVADRVTFTGRIEPDELLNYYRAADALILMSRREGMPNVVLESLACGTPVLATAVGGIPEVLTVPDAGELVHERTPERLADAWRALSERCVEAESVRRHAENFSWSDSMTALGRLLRSCVNQ